MILAFKGQSAKRDKFFSVNEVSKAKINDDVWKKDDNIDTLASESRED